MPMHHHLQKKQDTTMLNDAECLTGSPLSSSQMGLLVDIFFSGQPKTAGEHGFNHTCCASKIKSRMLVYRGGY